MKLVNVVDIHNNIITCTIKAEYNNPLTSEEEQEIETLHDYVRKLKFTDIDFSADIDMSTGMPIVTASSTPDTVKVTLPAVTNKEYVIDENLEIKFSLDVTRIAESELNDKITTAILMGQARAAIFVKRIEEKISEILTQMRDEDNDFEGVSETII